MHVFINRSSSPSGNVFGFSAFLNGKYLGSGQGTPVTDVANDTFAFPEGYVTTGRNVIAIVQDSSGTTAHALNWT